MPRGWRFILGWGAIAIGLIATGARAELSLVCDRPEGAVKVERVGLNQLVGKRAGDVVRLPLEATYRVEGDLRREARRLYWPTYYYLSHPPARERLPAEQRPWFGYVRVVSGDGWNGDKAEEIWAEKHPDVAVLVFGWMVHGEIVQTKIMLLPDKSHRSRFRLDHLFQLSPAEIGGVPVVLLWANGAFVPVRPAFKDPAAQRAVEAVLLSDLAGLRAALSPELLKAASRGGHTLLRRAAMAGNVEAIDLLLERGARTDTILPWTPLMYAAAFGRLPAVERLLAAKADPRRYDRRISPLQIALHSGHEVIAERLFEASASAAVDGTDLPSALEQAITGGHTRLARKLLAGGAGKSFKPGASKLSEQVILGHVSTVALVLEHKADPNVKVNGTVPLVVATRSRDVPLVKVLLAGGARPDLADDSGLTSLMAACVAGDLEIARLLLATGASAGVRRADGNTSVHFAATQGSPELMGLLIASGADIDAVGAGKMRPLDVALLTGRKDVAQLLVARGATVDPGASHAARLIEAAVMLDVPSVVQRAVAEGWRWEEPLPGGAMVAKLAKLAGATDVLKLLEADESANSATAADTVAWCPVDQLDGPLIQLREIKPPDVTDHSEGRGEQRAEVELLINETGRVVGTRILSCPDGRLALGCIETLRHWRFSPPTRRTAPVATQVRQTIVFPVPPEIPLGRAFVDVPPWPITRWLPSAGPWDAAGDVRVGCVVDREGHAEELRVLDAQDARHARTGANAAPEWAFTPGWLRGAPVRTRTEFAVPVNF